MTDFSPTFVVAQTADLPLSLGANSVVPLSSIPVRRYEWRIDREYDPRAKGTYFERDAFAFRARCEELPGVVVWGLKLEELHKNILNLHNTLKRRVE